MSSLTLGTQCKQRRLRSLSLRVLPSSSIVNEHCHVGVRSKCTCSTLHSLQLLSLAPCSSHPDSLMQMAAHTLPPFLRSASDTEGEPKAPIANIRNSVNIFIITLSFIKGHSIGTRVWDQVMAPRGQTHNCGPLSAG